MALLGAFSVLAGWTGVFLTGPPDTFSVVALPVSPAVSLFNASVASWVQWDSQALLDSNCSSPQTKLASQCAGAVRCGRRPLNAVPAAHVQPERAPCRVFPRKGRSPPSPGPAHTPTHHQDVLQKVQVAEGALRPVPQGSGTHLLTHVRVEGCLLEREKQ